VLNDLKFGVSMGAVDRFIDEMGIILQESGGSRISGRIFGLLLTEGKELSLLQISERLGVSRASVSTNARMLTRSGVLKLTTHAGDRQDYYQMAKFAYTDIIGDLSFRFRRYAQTLEPCAEDVRAEDKDAAARIDHLTSFYVQSADILDNWAETFRNSGPNGDKND